jgi:hypothetical protein
MKMDVRCLDCTLDQAQALIDAEKNAEVVRAIWEVVNGSTASYGARIDAIGEVLRGAGVIN